MRPVTRLQPALGVRAYQTYQVLCPPDRLIVSTCSEIGCPWWRNGWDSPIDESTEKGREQAAFIRLASQRTFRELRTATGVTVFRFESGQRCFEEHKTRPEIYAVRDGDWRGNPTGRRRIHQRPADWIEDFGEHQQRIADQHERG